MAQQFKNIGEYFVALKVLVGIYDEHDDSINLEKLLIVRMIFLFKHFKFL